MHCAMASAWITSCRGPTSQPDAPARHGMRLGKTADGHHLLGQSRPRDSALGRPGASPAYTSSATTHKRMPARQIADHRQVRLRSRSRRSDCSAWRRRSPRVRGVIAASSAARSTRNPCAAGAATRTIRAPDTRAWPGNSGTGVRARSLRRRAPRYTGRSRTARSALRRER